MTPSNSPSRSSTWVFLGLAVVFALLVFRGVLVPGHILFTSDDNIGSMAYRKTMLPEGFWRGWYSPVLAGHPTILNLTWTNVLLWLFPVHLFHNFIHAIDLVVASLALGLFLRERGVRWSAAAVGALASFWLGSTFFLTYAGHIGKFGVVMFAALSVWCIECAARRRSLRWALLGGGAMGAMFLEQADVALFFALVLGPYAIFATWRESGFRIVDHLRVVVPVAAFALVVGFRAMWLASAFFSLDGTADAPPEDRKEVWSYCTQWSWPPEETLEWIAPGYYGWRSGDVEGPYWGRLGRSDGWEQTRQGFPNFKLETLYLGSIPVVLALLAIFLAFSLRRIAKPDVVFWTAAAAVTFVLGLGKFTPLYQLFFALPGMSSIRGPVKFMQVTQFALGILAALGLEGLLRHALAGDRDRVPVARFSFFERAMWIAGGLLILMALGLGVSSSGAIQQVVADGWGNAAGVIVRNRIGALVHGGLLWLSAGLLVTLLVRVRKEALVQRLAWVAAALMAADQLLVSHRYVQSVAEEGYINANAATQFLKQEQGVQRTFLASQGSFYNQWLSVLFLYQDIPTYNVTQIRMPKDYEQFMQAIGQDLPRLWQYFAVGHIMGPSGIWPELQNNEPFRGKFELGFAYNVVPRGVGVDVVPATAARPGQHVIVRHRAPADRFAVIGGWDGLEPAATLQRLRDPATKPLERVLIPTEVAAGLPASTTNGLVGAVEVEKIEPGYMKLKVTANQSAILRASDKYSPYWQAQLNGKSVPVFRCDYVFTGIALEPGIHSVVLEHRPPLSTLWLQLSGLAACALCIGGLAVRRKSDTE